METCPECGNPVVPDGEAIRCDGCREYIHPDCWAEHIAESPECYLRWRGSFRE